MNKGLEFKEIYWNMGRFTLQRMKINRMNKVDEMPNLYVAQSVGALIIVEDDFIREKVLLDWYVIFLNYLNVYRKLL